MEVIYMRRWEPHTPSGFLVVLEASCCERFILCYDDAGFFVKHRTEDGRLWETGRGNYAKALNAWQWLRGWHVHGKRVAS